jgi:predicted alpha/beta superfamily hydrolase
MRDRSFFYSYLFKTVLLLLTFWLSNDIHAQLTINITSVPSTTPQGESIYIAGNFNSWDPGNTDYILDDHQNGTYSITFSPNPGTLEFKFTRGSWATVEGNAQGGFVPNRTFTYNGGVQSTSVTIAGWEDNPGEESTAAENVEIIDTDFFIPQLNRSRRVWLYLPPDYNTSSKRYPVVYMQDGQNLFDVLTSFSGEWKVDESMNDLFKDSDYGAIVVGIDNGGGERINEYSPWINPNYGGGEGEAYAEFLVQTLKPHIDSTYRTLPEREYTAIAGSSMGANISMYAGIEYQDVFGKVGIFSPAFWFTDSAYLHLASKGITNDLRVYFVAGQNESSGMIADMMEMYDALVDAGQEASEMYFLSEPDGAHSEWFWAREYPDAYEWLFDDLLLADQFIPLQSLAIHPNPVKDQLAFNRVTENLEYVIFTLQGAQIDSGLVQQGFISVEKLLPGYYILQISDHSGKKLFVDRFVKQH